ncbi:hypothetical protein GQY15_17105 [Rhodobacter sphaeroides]|uniref:hypothetical protein n=1 Tax=Cereibacter sphaeroides TaxID=1063 RepID=UPI001323824E|nr:hypothetical protein [Cereibacter sphaeroides]MWP39287.1 hypothetical protein [Cereibacter sphaeroides]
MIKISAPTAKQIAITMLIASPFLVALDHFLARKADQRVFSHSGYFSERVAEAHLNFSGPRAQACHVGYEFHVYAYQTCFVIPADISLSKLSAPDENIRFDFIYHKPQPWVTAFRLSSEYYFSAPELGETLRTIGAAEADQRAN